MVETSDMRERILDLAQALVQVHGYDGFSFADIAERVGIRKASIHHHFPTKAELGRQLVARFRVDCERKLAALDDLAEPESRLEGYVAIFRATLESGRMCLCGVLAAGFANLPDPVRSEVRRALDDQETWLVGVIREGRDLGVFRTDRTPELQASLLLNGLEGALLLARVRDDQPAFEALARSLLDAIRERSVSASSRGRD